PASRPSKRDAVVGAGLLAQTATNSARNHAAGGGAHMLDTEPAGDQHLLHDAMSRNEHSLIPRFSTARRILGSHNAASSCRRSARYIVSRSAAAAGWQQSSTTPSGKSARIPSSPSTLMWAGKGEPSLSCP